MLTEPWKHFNSRKEDLEYLSLLILILIYLYLNKNEINCD